MKIDIRKWFWAAREFLNGVVPPEKRIHPDFRNYDGEQWFSNAHMQKADSSLFRPDDMKVRILMNESDLHKLDNCPYIAKLGPSIDPNFPLKYCAFLYPKPGVNNIEDLEKWVEDRSFPNASVFEYGHMDHRAFRWVPGKRVRRLKAATGQPS